MEHKQKIICEQITAFFENLSTEFAYDYVENLRDGRGITCGRSGFCTGTGDCYLVVKRYDERQQDSPLAKFLPELLRLNTASDPGRTSHLRGFKKAWIAGCEDEVFRRCQDEINDELYWNPAQKYVEDFRFVLPVTSACFYDTIIQHGDGDDPDSIGEIINRTRTRLENSSPNEKDWLTIFIEIRHQILLEASDPETRKVWRESASRAVALKNLISTNPELKTPFTLKCFGAEVILT